MSEKDLSRYLLARDLTRRRHEAQKSVHVDGLTPDAQTFALLEAIVANQREMVAVLDQLRLVARATVKLAEGGGPAATAAHIAFLATLVNALAMGEHP